ncbi:DUF4435 domain-containing protein [Herpetosiphon geysericola]|nr:DUF4435 domain-containing protein [Herpetosiphon geysericola]
MDMDVYLTYITMSNKKHILVEGNSDQEMISKFTERLVEKYSNFLGNIDIDIVGELLRSCIENVRERVLFISDFVNYKIKPKNFLSFIDREFWGFIIEPNIVDIISNHNVDGLTICSRGHSIENYLFNSTILGEVFYNLSSLNNNQKNMAIILFKKIFIDSLKTACAISITAFLFNKINKINKDPFHKYIEINDDFSFNLDNWIFFIKNKFQLEDKVINEMSEKFLYIYRKVSILDVDKIQWICHGHIGLQFLWDTFSKCVYSITNGLSEDKRQKAFQNSRKFDTNTIFSIGTIIWSYRYLNNQEVFCDDVVNFCLQ